MAHARNNRDCALDCIRILSIIGILVCHSCFEWQVDWVGRLLGLTFNFLFLGISAYIFGIEWKKKGNCPYDFSFVTKRTIKLATTYYPFLIILFLFLLISKQDFSTSNIFSHLVFLSWFDKIEGFGHLWFMTMILICYVGIWIISKLVNITKDNSLNANLIHWGGGIVLCYMGLGLDV